LERGKKLTGIQKIYLPGKKEKRIKKFNPENPKRRTNWKEE